MKPLTLFFTLTLAAVLISANAIADPVLDTDGDPLYLGVSYYVLPSNSSDGERGLTLTGRGSNSCPQDIALSASEMDRGYPVKFTPMFSPTFVPESNNNFVEVVAPEDKTCYQPTYWWLDHRDKERNKTFVTTVQRHLSPFKRNFFMIEKTKSNGRGYKFVSAVKSLNIGIFIDEKGVRRLALNKEPYEVVFVKADQTMGSKMII